MPPAAQGRADLVCQGGQRGSPAHQVSTGPTHPHGMKLGQTVMTLLTKPRGKGGPGQAARAFLPLSSARKRRQWGLGTPPPVNHLLTGGEYSQQMLSSHQLSPCPALSIYEVHLPPVTAFSIGYSHHQLSAPTLAG